MNETPVAAPAPSTDETAPAAAVGSPAPPVASVRFALLTARWLGGALVLVVLIWVGTEIVRENAAMRLQINDFRQASAAALAENDRRLAQMERTTEQLREDLDEVKSQRTAIDQLYAELTRGRDDAALLEIERLLTLAAQELQVTGDVSTALGALQAADARLARFERPQLHPLRRAIAADLARLRAVPVVDVTGVALKVDQLVEAIDTLPMLADAGPRLATKAAPAPDSVPKKSGRKDPASAAAATAAVPAGLWPRLRRWLADEFGDLVQVHTVAVPEAMLLSVDQQYFVRQQLKLRLLNAREALLAHNDRLFRADINEALSVLARFFDNHQATVAAALAQLKQLAVAMPAVNVPTVTESLAALHALRPISPPPH